MSFLIPLALILGITAAIVLTFWLAARMIRWARRGTKSGALFGLGMSLPAAGINPQPPPQIKIEEVKRDIQGRKNSDSADPDNPKP
jgi:predicted phage tail protein